MSLGIETDLSAAQSAAVAATVREELARRRISRQRLAEEAKISLSTLEKALSGRRPFTLATTIRLEVALGVALRRAGPTPSANGADHGGPAAPSPTRFPGLAPEELGSYARPAVTWIEGSYLTLRPSFGNPDGLYAYRTEILWDEAASGLAFREGERLDAAFTQDGMVSVPNQSGYIYLVTNRHGQYRLITVARPTISGEMHGILTTLLAGRGAQLTPVATPIVLVPLRGALAAEACFGQILPGHPCFERYSAALRRTVEEPFALFLPGVRPG